MNWMHIKSYLPRTLFGRAALIYLVPVLTILGVMAIVFVQRLYEDVTGQMTMGVADEIGLILTRVEFEETKASALMLAEEIATPLGFEIGFDRPGVTTRRTAIDLSGSTVISTLIQRYPDVVGVDLASSDGRVLIELPSRHGPLVIDAPRSRFSARNPHQFLVLIGATALIMTLIALLYLRGQVRPIRRLAAAATAFGKGRNLPYNPTGAAEVREAGQAFLEMRARIERQIEQRTMMLSGVSHDLRTPLTRMRLELGMSDDTELADHLTADISEMETMLNAFLDFARNDASEEMKLVEVAGFIHSVVEKFSRLGQNIETSVAPELSKARIQPLAMERALTNLLSNAGRYAENARLSVQDTGDHLSFIVEDDGPGIPAGEIEQAMKPFSRLDEARNQDAGSGVGLGLAIASGIARQHGGQLELGKSAVLGGLRADIIVPR